MKLLKLHILFITLLFTMDACDVDDKEQAAINCDKTVIISAEEFKNAPKDFVKINNITIDGNCLVINFGSSGCDGSTWIIRLIDSGAVAESYPPQRFLRLSLRNEEPCDAYFTKTIRFDIENLQVEGNNVIINIEGYDQPVPYKY